MIPIKQKEIYGNFKVHHPDGTLMFRCAEDRAKWYLDRNLAELIDPTTIKLTFVPQGKGHVDEPFYLSEKKNQCVVCGSLENLTQHHAVPICFRRHFPDHLKSRCSHDVLPVCGSCHVIYEKPAFELKKQLADKYGFSINMSTTDFKMIKAKNCASALLSTNNIPEIRKIELRDIIARCFDKIEVTDAEIIEASKYCAKKSTKRYGEEIVRNLENIEDFIKMWRQHFVSTMNPQFLSEYWDVNHRLS